MLSATCSFVTNKTSYRIPFGKIRGKTNFHKLQISIRGSSSFYNFLQKVTQQSYCCHIFSHAGSNHSTEFERLAPSSNKISIGAVGMNHDGRTELSSNEDVSTYVSPRRNNLPFIYGSTPWLGRTPELVKRVAEEGILFEEKIIREAIDKDFTGDFEVIVKQ